MDTKLTEHLSALSENDVLYLWEILSAVLEVHETLDKHLNGGIFNLGSLFNKRLSICG